MANAGQPSTQVRIPVRVRLSVGLATTAVVVVLSGCATVPSGGPPQQVNPGNNQVQAYVQPLPPPGPKAYDRPGQVVLAFLHASASYAFDPAAARQFLLPTLRTTWHPGPVTVVSSVNLRPATGSVRSPLDASSASGPSESVVLSGQRLATLSKTGQYQYSPGTSTYKFTLQKVNGVWLISELPAGQDTLLLTQEDFEHVYQPRNLFFFALPPSAPNSKLVPDPVYAPLQNSVSALNINLARELVTGLLADKRSWLSGATTTEFPVGTKLLGVKISGQTAVVNLGGAVIRASPIQKQDMAEQLQATLGSTAYSTPLAHFVQLEINGRTTDTPANPSGSLIYSVPRGPVVYQSAPYSVSEGLGRSPSAGPWESGSGSITAIAMDPANAPLAGPLAVAAKNSNGCEVYLRNERNEQPTGPYHRFPLSTTGGDCTSLSWDGNGNVWAAAGRKIWVLALDRAQQWQAQPVALPVSLTPSGQPAPQILALRMAPDAVRAALLIRSGASNYLALAAVQEEGGLWSLGNPVAIATGLRDPISMSWFSPYDLIVLDASSGIVEVPLAGGAAQSLGSAPAGAESLTTDGVTVEVGTADHEIQMSTKLPPVPTAITWHPKRLTGALPIYPG